MKELKMEIMGVGIWNKVPITMGILKEFASNFNKLSGILDVSLKLGHNDEQPLKAQDGQMAFGSATSMWVEGETLFANVKNIPDIVYEAIDKELFKNVSIEAFFDVKHEGTNYGSVLTAIALLGADLPAVNSLSGLKAYMSEKNLAFSSHATFSKNPLNEHSGGSTMTPEEKVEMDALKATITAQKAVIGTHATESANFTSKIATHEATIGEMKTSSATAKFAAEKLTVTSDLETLVKEGKMTSGQRDKILKEFSLETKEQTLFSISIFKDGVGVKPKSKSTAKEGEGETDVTPSEKVNIEVAKLRASNSDMTYSTAVQTVFSINTTLAAEYAAENDQGE